MFYLFNKKKLKYDNISFYIVSSIIIFSLIIGFLIKNNLRKETLVREKLIETVSVQEIDPFSPEKLKVYIKELNIKFPEIVYAQSIEETGDFNSNIFLENNNLFGMKMAKQRPYTYSGENRGHAYYNHWRESVLDYALFQGSYLKGVKTETQYFEYLDRNYAEKKGYSNRLKKIIKNDTHNNK